MEYDAQKLATLFSQLAEARGRLVELSALTPEEFASDPHKVASAKYHFIVAIEAAVDICNHLIAKNGLRLPQDYADSFRVMGEANVFSPAFVEQLVAMAKFRNRLVHMYWKVDTQELYRILRERLADFDVYMAAIGEAMR